MRILQVHSRYREPGGEDRVVEMEADLLLGAGHHVTRHWVDNDAGGPASYGRFAASPWNPLAAHTAVVAAERSDSDLAHVHNTWFSLSGSVVVALARAGIPTVMTLHNYRLLCIAGTLFREGRHCTDCVGRMPLPGVLHRCYRGSALMSTVAASGLALQRAKSTWEKFVDLFLVPTDAAREVLVQGGLPAERIRVKSNFTADPGERSRPPSASNTLLFVGRIAPGKGLDVLLEAWRHGIPSSYRLDVIGDGPERAKLERCAPAGVRFLGRLAPDEVQRRMKSARALIFPSVWLEPFGMVLIEAMACGLPVVGSEIAGSRAILDPMTPDALVPPGHPALLAKALLGLRDGEAIDDSGAAGRRRFHRLFSPQANLPLLEEAYHSVVGTRPGCRRA